MERKVIRARVLVPGEASGEAIVSPEPLSFWGGYDSDSGEIIDRRHPLSGQIASGKILVLPFTKGSSTTTAVLLESVNNGTAPVGIITSRVDSFLSLASIVADEMYQKPIPIVAVSPEELLRFESGQKIEMCVDGTVLIS